MANEVRKLKSVSKFKYQLSPLSACQIPIAGSTSAMVAENEQAPAPPECPSHFLSSNTQTYAVRFIQHAPEPVATPSLYYLEAERHSSQRPDKGYALKYPTGKRTVLSQAQKDIMVQFYNRQAINHISQEM